MDIIQHSPIRNRCTDRVYVGKEQKMKCENCSHAEMCRWIDGLEGRGCDFYDGKPCELLILKSDILLHQDDRKKWAESIEQEKAKGLIILPPYFTPVLVPDDVEIQIEQEPCDDAISRETIEDIKADIEAARYGLINDGLDVALRIIDKHCPSCGAKMESEE